MCSRAREILPRRGVEESLGFGPRVVMRKNSPIPPHAF